MFSPKDQLAVLLYAYHKGISSSVKIAELLRYNLQFIYLAGGHIIKRRTICDFRLKHIKSIKELFTSSTQLALESGLISEENVFALDGSKIEAHAGYSMTRSKGEWKDRREQILNHVEKYLKDCEEQDELEENAEDEQIERFNRIKEKLNSIKKPRSKEETEEKAEVGQGAEEIKSPEDSTAKENDDVSAKKKNRVKIEDDSSAEKYLDEYDKIATLLEQHKKTDDRMLLNLNDPDCRIMKSDGTTKECYNAQIITNNQIIVAMDVTQDENDQAQLEPMVEQLKSNLKFQKEISLVADAGYNRGKNLAYIDKEDNINAYISMHDRSGRNNSAEIEFHKENFHYDEDNDVWVCPTGSILEFKKDYYDSDKKYSMYGCELKTCIKCDTRKDCLTTKADIRRGYRTIEDDGFIVFRKEMKDKMRQKPSKEIYAKRSPEVEGVFGQMKYNKRLDKFRLQGLQKVTGEFTLMAISHNLGKIMRSLLQNVQFKEAM
jgi:hypothetical protein